MTAPRSGPGCVVQTHLFHDRVMSLDVVTLADGATLGPHGVVLPAAALDVDATVGPALPRPARRDRPGGLALGRQPDRPVASPPAAAA